MKLRKVTLYLALSAAALLGAIPCWAVDLPVVNPSFESPVLSQGQTQDGVEGWTFVTGGSGTSAATAYPDVGDFPSIPHGNQVAVITAVAGWTTPRIEQAAGALEAGKRYTLSVDIGARGDLPTGGYYIQLLSASSSVLAAAYWDPVRTGSTGPALTSGMFTNVSVSGYSSTAPTGDIGQPLTIRLFAFGTNPGAAQQITFFDNVKVTAEDPPLGPSNQSFEIPALSEGATIAGAESWTFLAGGTGTSVATWYPPSGVFTSIPDGNQVAELTATPSPSYTTPELQQQVATLEADMVYTLSVDIGAQSDVYTGGYWIGLQVPGYGSVLFTWWDPDRPSAATGPTLTPGSFIRLVLSGDSGSLPAEAVGAPVLLRMLAFGTPTGPAVQKTYFDNVRITKTPRSELGEINGSVSLSDFHGDAELVPIRVDLLQGGALIDSTFVDDVTSQYRLIGIVPGTYSVAFNTAQFLREVVSNVEVTGGGTVTLPLAALVNGDTDGDNEINSTDLSTVLKSIQ